MRVFAKAQNPEFKIQGLVPHSGTLAQRDLQDGQKDGQEDNIADQVTAPEPLPMAGHLLFARAVGRRQRDATDRLDLFKLGGLIAAGGQGAAMHPERVLGIVGGQVGGPVV